MASKAPTPAAASQPAEGVTRKIPRDAAVVMNVLRSMVRRLQLSLSRLFLFFPLPFICLPMVYVSFLHARKFGSSSRVRACERAGWWWMGKGLAVQGNRFPELVNTLSHKLHFSKRFRFRPPTSLLLEASPPCCVMRLLTLLPLTHRHLSLSRASGRAGLGAARGQPADGVRAPYAPEPKHTSFPFFPHVQKLQLFRVAREPKTNSNREPRERDTLSSCPQPTPPRSPSPSRRSHAPATPPSLLHATDTLTRFPHPPYPHLSTKQSKQSPHHQKPNKYIQTQQDTRRRCWRSRSCTARWGCTSCILLTHSLEAPGSNP
jgi:hypothetical protein